jgi:hypothetical protein
MRWNKLEYGKWPTGRIALRIVSDNGYVQIVVGNIETKTFVSKKDIYKETFFIHDNNEYHTMIRSICDTEPHYIELDKLEMPS